MMSTKTRKEKQKENKNDAENTAEPRADFNVPVRRLGDQYDQ